MLARNLLILVLALAVFVLAARSMLSGAPPLAQTPVTVQPAQEPRTPPLEEALPGLVADISLHTADELDLLLSRVEQLLERPRSGTEQPLISLVLHGPEVEFFALKNYPRYREVVDRAAKLAALGAVDISICQTQMRNLGIGQDEVPAFLKQVPFGPAEVQRLKREEGFVTM